MSEECHLRVQQYHYQHVLHHSLVFCQIFLQSTLHHSVFGIIYFQVGYMLTTSTLFEETRRVLDSIKFHILFHTKRRSYGGVSLMERLLHPELENAFSLKYTRRKKRRYKQHVLNVYDVYIFVLISAEIG